MKKELPEIVVKGLINAVEDFKKGKYIVLTKGEKDNALEKESQQEIPKVNARSPIDNPAELPLLEREKLYVKSDINNTFFEGFLTYDIIECLKKYKTGDYFHNYYKNIRKKCKCWKETEVLNKFGYCKDCWFKECIGDLE